MARVDRLNDQQFMLSREPNRDPTDVLVKHAADENWGLYELGPAHSRLEDVFVQLTRDETDS